jgi:hypothetical protein
MVEEEIGKHRIRIEPPDLFVVTHDGDISFQEAAAIMHRLEAFTAGKDRVFLLLDVRRAGNMPPEARKGIVGTMGRLPVGGVAIFGATFSIRVAATLMAKAASLLHPSAPAASFFASEADARAWLDDRRGASAS